MDEVTDEPLYRHRVCGIDIGKAGMAATIRASDREIARRFRVSRISANRGGGRWRPTASASGLGVEVTSAAVLERIEDLTAGFAPDVRVALAAGLGWRGHRTRRAHHHGLAWPPGPWAVLARLFPGERAGNRYLVRPADQLPPELR